MRTILFGLMITALTACGSGSVSDDDDDNGDGGNGGADSSVNPGDPVLIAGGGVGPGAIDGTLHVYVIDAKSGAPLSGATVRVGAPDAGSPLEATTDGSGLHTFTDGSLSGAQTVTATASGYAAATWFGVTGLNVTLPLRKRPEPNPATANVSGTIDGWSSMPAPSGNDYNAAFVAYSTTEDYAEPENNIVQATDGNDLPVNTCLRTYIDNPACNWQMKVRTGKQIHYAILVRGDSHGSTDPADHDITLYGIAVKTGLDLTANQTITGETLTMISAGNLQNVTATVPAPPGGIDSAVGLPFLDMGEYGQLIFAIPTLTPSDNSTKVIALSGEFAGGKYLMAGAAAPSAENVDYPKSSTFQRDVNIASPVTLAAWLPYATGLSASGGSYSFTPVSGASLQAVTFYDGAGNTQWSVVLLDGTTSFTLPALSPDPLPSGNLEMRVLAADVAGFASDDFSLDDWSDQLARVSEASTSFTH